MFTTNMTKIGFLNIGLGVLDLGLAYYLNEPSMALCAFICLALGGVALLKH